MKWFESRAMRLFGSAALALAAVSVPAFAADATSKPADPKPKAAPAKPNAPEEPKDMKPLFNGKDLAGWEGDARLWKFEDGTVVGRTTAENVTKGNTFLVWKGGDVADFELRFAFRIKSGNSGVQYRSTLLPVTDEKAENKWRVKGYQCEIANVPNKVGFVYHEGGPGKTRGYADNGNYLAKVGDKTEISADGKHAVTGTVGGQSAIAAAYKNGDWNECVIIAKGPHIRHFVNGVQTVDLTDNDEKNKMTSGVLALQIHAGPPMTVEFKDVRIKQ